MMTSKSTRALLVAAPLLAGLILVACASGGAPAASSATSSAGGGNATAGKAVFDSNCTGCHPGGKAGVGPSLVGIVGRLAQAGVTRQVREGGSEMPAFSASQISDQQLSDLIAYLGTLK